MSMVCGITTSICGIHTEHFTLFPLISSHLIFSKGRHIYPHFIVEETKVWKSHSLCPELLMEEEWSQNLKEGLFPNDFPALGLLPGASVGILYPSYLTLTECVPSHLDLVCTSAERGCVRPLLLGCSEENAGPSSGSLSHNCLIDKMGKIITTSQGSWNNSIS